MLLSLSGRTQVIFIKWGTYVDQIMTMKSHYGFIVLILAFCLGPFGIPVPNEVTIIAARIMNCHGLLHPFYTFASILFGMTSAVTLGYWIGRLASKYGFLRKLSQLGGNKKAEQFYIRHCGTALSRSIELAESKPHSFQKDAD